VSARPPLGSRSPALRAKTGKGSLEGSSETGVLEEIAAEFSTEELLEFLEADQLPVKADPQFRERLRAELWELIRSQIGDDPKR
jgi:hypothetical protein